MTNNFKDTKVLAFDVFGTVVDWRSCVIAEGEQLGKAKGLNIDWTAFADAWRGIYRPYMDRVGAGELPWTKLDDLHRQMLEATLKQFGVNGLNKTEKGHFNRVWQAWKRADWWITVSFIRFIFEIRTAK